MTTNPIIHKGDKVRVTKRDAMINVFAPDSIVTVTKVGVRWGEGYIEAKGINSTNGEETLQYLSPRCFLYKDSRLVDRSQYTVIPRHDSQKRKLIKLLANGGTIDRKEALNEMHIFNLTARIAELRALGVKINMRWKTDRAGVTHVTYFMTVQGLRQAVRDHFVKKQGGAYVPLAI